MVKVGIIGGSGVGGLSNDDLVEIKTSNVSTPFGDPSSQLVEATLLGVPVVFIGRHGPGHSISPTNVNFRANIIALKERGCTHILSTTACGSLMEGMRPGDVVLLDQFIDWTTKRQNTFFDGTQRPTGDRFYADVTHVPMSDPFCSRTRRILAKCCEKLKKSSTLDYHNGGTMVTVEGPRFSTRAESRMFQLLGANLINMTTATEAALAREAGIPYAAIALVTDYDCWKEHGEDLNVEAIMKQMDENRANALALIREAVVAISAEEWGDLLDKMEREVKNSQVTSK